MARNRDLRTNAQEWRQWHVNHDGNRGPEQTTRALYLEHPYGINRSKFRNANDYSLYRVYHNKHSYLWISKKPRITSCH